MSELKQADQGKKPAEWRPRLFGRGTAFMIIGLLVIGVWRLTHPPKVVIERQVQTSGEAQIKRKPDVSDLLDWAQDLNLKRTQKESLRKLLSEEQIKLSPVEEEIAKVTQEFNQFASKHAAEPTGLKELKAAAQPISELSLMKRRIMQGFAEQGLGVLDETQKEKAGQLWEAKLARLRDRKKEVANP